METAIKRAIEGGYKYNFADTFLGQPYGNSNSPKFYWQNDDNGSYEELKKEQVLFDPLFWQCLGKAEGWGGEWDTTNGGYIVKSKDYLPYWHSFIDHLVDGKPIDDFFNQLLK